MVLMGVVAVFIEASERAADASRCTGGGPVEVVEAAAAGRLWRRFFCGLAVCCFAWPVRKASARKSFTVVVVGLRAAGVGFGGGRAYGLCRELALLLWLPASLALLPRSRRRSRGARGEAWLACCCAYRSCAKASTRSRGVSMHVHVHAQCVRVCVGAPAPG